MVYKNRLLFILILVLTSMIGVSGAVVKTEEGFRYVECGVDKNSVNVKFGEYAGSCQDLQQIKTYAMPKATTPEIRKVNIKENKEVENIEIDVKKLENGAKFGKTTCDDIVCETKIQNYAMPENVEPEKLTTKIVNIIKKCLVLFS